MEVVKIVTSDIHMSVHRKCISKLLPTSCNVIYLFISTDALHVSGGSSANHQEHTIVHTALGIVNHLIHDTSKQQYWLTIPKAVCTIVCS